MCSIGPTPVASRWSRASRFEWRGRAAESVPWPALQRALRVAPHEALLARHAREVEDVRRRRGVGTHESEFCAEVEDSHATLRAACEAATKRSGRHRAFSMENAQWPRSLRSAPRADLRRAPSTEHRSAPSAERRFTLGADLRRAPCAERRSAPRW
ncbi:hypothetical protein T492DRAFT_74073 [Pavlovales sp. CCMP2436]|nr:hypothetical protein T492DRAFT_74073 [Pavlovales sp. CCMP2436]